jgi:hypothetical protein
LEIHEWLILFWSFCTFIVAATVLAQLDKAVNDIADVKREIRAHQDWLFEQLYSMAPGKVLKPDEVATEATAKVAYVYSPTKDPMSEFNGMKDDFHG